MGSELDPVFSDSDLVGGGGGGVCDFLVGHFQHYANKFEHQISMHTYRAGHALIWVDSTLMILIPIQELVPF